MKRREGWLKFFLESYVIGHWLITSTEAGEWKAECSVGRLNGSSAGLMLGSGQQAQKMDRGFICLAGVERKAS
jgi:hypothetical protein